MGFNFIVSLRLHFLKTNQRQLSGIPQHHAGLHNEAMDTIASLITQEHVEREPLKYQLKTLFHNLSDGEQLKVVTIG